MPYQGFWGLCALALILLGHGVYCFVTTTRDKTLQRLPKGPKAVLGALMLLCLAGLMGGVVMMLCRMEEAAVHVMGLVVLLSAFALNDRLRRYLPRMIQKEEQEETKDE